MELGTLMASTGRPFSLLMSMEGFKFELDSSMFRPPQAAIMAERPYNRSQLPPLTNRRGAEELHSSDKKRIGPSRSRRDARRWQAHLLKKRNVEQSSSSLSPLPAPTPATGGGQAGTGAPVASPSASDAQAAENLLDKQLTKRGPGRPPKKRKGMEELRGSDSGYPLDPSTGPDSGSDEETRDERLLIVEEEEVLMEEEVEKEEVVVAELETLCL